MRYFILDAACAFSIIVTAYSALPSASPGPTAGVAVATLPATPAAIVAATTPKPRGSCDIDEGMWKPWSGHAATTPLPDETPQVFSDTMALSPPGGSVPMPNACLPQQTPQPTTQPELLPVVEPAAP